MKSLPLRRGQLVTTFGPGSIVISPEGESAIIGALDKWYYDINGNQISTLDEYEIHEPRLKSLLKVDKLLLPPDYRPSHKYKRFGDEFSQLNTDIFIPLLRFPKWHYCPTCKTLHEIDLSNRSSWLNCKRCKKLKKMIQVPFVIVCKNGHISDFPWREWVHGDENTTCEGQMRLLSTGGATLDSLKVRCCNCKKERSLRGIMSRKTNSDNEEGISELSKMLNINSSKLYHCPGHKPWFGEEKEKEDCDAYPVAVLKNSVSVYYPNKISAIYLPGENLAVENLLEIFERYQINSSWLSITNNLEDKIKLVKKLCPPEIQQYNKSDIELAILYTEGAFEETDSTKLIDSTNVEDDLRKKEFEALLKEIDSTQLKVKLEWNNKNVDDNSLEKCFGIINRITKLKETIVLIGFNRLITNDNKKIVNNIKTGKKLLFKEPNLSKNNWLPAYKVFGEGIFFTLNTQKLSVWEQRVEVSNYFNKMISRIEKKGGNVSQLNLNPRKVLIHTLSHIIIDELALTCGYNVASIRERLYFVDDKCGILIYTSSGDIEGTFGGLVRMGKKENFFPVVYRAIEKARWCSSDPVCSEVGKTSGQGFNNINGAACHSCSYLPETSCELGNLYLDRTLLIDPILGFFA